MSQSSPNITKLIGWLNRGNKQAFNQLFAMYHHKLFLYTFRILKSKEVANDIVQDTFVKIWGHRKKINPQQSFEAYLFRIGKNLIVDHFRKISRRDNFVDDMATSLSLYHNHTENQVLYNDMKKFTQSVIDKLPAQRQQIFRMSRENGLSHEEIAYRLGISKHTVKANISKSLKTIRSFLVNNVD